MVGLNRPLEGDFLKDWISPLTDSVLALHSQHLPPLAGWTG